VSEKTKESKKEGNQNNASMVFLGYGCFFFMIITKNSTILGFLPLTEPEDRHTPSS
jgi:hypothetical protein